MDRSGSDRPEGRTALVGKELSRYGIDIAALSETRLADEGQVAESGCGYTFFWIGKPADQPRTAGVGFAIRRSVLTKLESLPKGINERLMTLKIKLKDNALVSVYAPTQTNDDDGSRSCTARRYSGCAFHSRHEGRRMLDRPPPRPLKALSTNPDSKAGQRGKRS